MVLGWRRAFCTSIPRDQDSSRSTTTTKQEKSNPTTPKFGSKLGFFSNPSTPRLQSQPVSSPTLRCRTTSPAPTAASLLPADSPKLRCKTTGNSPRFYQRSNPSSPRSPSAFSFLKSTLRPSKARCGICLNGVKSGQGTAIFTAECTHSFHFPCIAAHFRKKATLTCPVCNSQWNQMPLLSIHNVSSNQKLEQEKKTELPSSPRTPPSKKANGKPILKVYNDDEPLMSPTSGARFNPIPESDENDEDDVNLEGDFQGFFPQTNVSPAKKTALTLGNMDMSLLPDAAVVSVGRSSQTYVVVLKVRAPSAPAKTARRAPIDLVMVLDVSGKMTSDKLHMMKQAMRLVVSSLSSADRLSIVAFSSTSKRLLPLRRMTTTGRRSARRMVDAIVALDGTAAVSANDALKKAAKVLEDRREKNLAASIILLSDGPDDRSANQRRQSSIVCSTRFPNLDIPVHSVSLRNARAYGHSPPQSEDVLSKCIAGLLSVVVQDVRIQLRFISGFGPGEISGVYSCMGRPEALGSGMVRVGDLYAEEERELLVELKVPSMSSVGAHHVLSVRCSYKDPSTDDQIQGREQGLRVPRPNAARSSTTSIERLRSLYVGTRAVAESRRLVERGDISGAHHMISSARALLLQSSSTGSAEEFVRGLEAELSELHWRRQNQTQVQHQRRRRSQNTERENAEEKSTEPLTPTSAWRAAERLAKVAIMRKSLNRVSDLHGFENARF